MRLNTDSGQARVDPDSQVVCCDLKDIVTHSTRIVRVVRQCLGIRQQQVLLVRCLQADAVLQRANVVPQVQRAGGSVAGQDNRVGADECCIAVLQIGTAVQSDCGCWQPRRPMNGGDGWVNDKAVPLLSGAPPQVRERDHDDSHADDIDETSEERKSA
jgi:hypothetical protein